MQGTGQDDDQRLIDYLLGNLPEPDQLRLEEEYLASADAQDRLAAIEDDLVDAYLEGGLSSRERKQLEARFLASPRGRRKLALAKSLMMLASAQKPAPRPKSFSVLPLRWAFSTVALIVVLALVWLAREKAARHRAPETAGRQPNPASSETPPLAPTPAENLLRHSQLPAVASITLSPIARNTDQLPRLKISPGTTQVAIQLGLEANHHKSYRATLLDAGDTVKWNGRHLKPESTTSGKAVRLSLPATLFENGEYTVLLGPDEDDTRTLAEYSFIVQRK